MELTPAGLLFMSVSWLSIILLTIYCFMKTLSEDTEKIVGTLEVEADIDAEEHDK
ncbi:hypothetical protein [Chitinivibrio alkaliphilus]|uniref:Uncharacterized protein n=1 Tax=Chitinivibrio alkaliphilus ACht1 TaxID=1313304 RepID=U7DAI3_9BACT|nr:hypothetical protein [Chitinivibrio alkaliphilus]ERP32142.1 hypothetical protein CALK_0869 [Chitinivibrio alkaliphilus ACht1]